MKASKVLFITQEITPYVAETEVSTFGRKVPQAIQETGREIRTFMPKWGNVNERRNQLHEVIRLSGMNLIIDDTDHPLIIKVASIPSARMQVYFIDNDDYFQHRLLAKDENDEEYDDNDERAVFYARGVLETVKKLRWYPGIIHCQGWASAIVPLYVKKAYNEDPSFRDAKVVFSLFDDKLEKPLQADIINKLMLKGIDRSEVESILPANANYDDLMKLAISYSDGVIQSSPNVNPELLEYARSKNIPVLEYHPFETFAEACNKFYSEICPEEQEEE
ncbi:MAG: glycogen/starch synthase [Bacteroidaceae bacterium]|nr:glycogen/starch synthase [Bacteroidaceae bacterium]